MASTQVPLPTQDKSDGTPGTAAPALAIQVGGTDGTNLRALKTDTSGNLLITGRVALSPASPTTASVGVTSASAVASNTSRKGLVIVNLSANRVSLGLGVAAVLGSGITLLPGGVWTMDDYTYTTSAVNAIAGAAASSISIQEFS